MSNATDNTGCISHRQHCQFFVMYEDFQDIAKAVSPEHEHKLAAFWRVLETKTNDKIRTIPEIAEDCKKRSVPIPEQYLWIEIPYSEFVNRSRGIYKASSFQIAAAESERVGFSKCRVLQRKKNPNDPNSPMEDYKEYLFLTDVMQSVLNGGEYPPPIEINSPLLKSFNARKEEKKRKRAIEKNRDPLLKSTEGAIEINNKKYIKVSSKDKEDKESTQEESTSPANTSSPAPVPQDANALVEAHTQSENQALHVDERPQNEQNEPLSMVTSNTDQKRGKRKPSVAKPPAITDERVETVFVHMEEVMRRLLRENGTPDEEFAYGRPKTDKKHIRDFLTGRTVTGKNLDMVMTTLWNKPPDPESNFDWKDNMSVRAICNNYDKTLIECKRKANKENTPPVKPAVKPNGRINFTRQRLEQEQQAKQATGGLR